MHATRFYKLLYYGCRAWQFSDNDFAGTTVGYVEWDHCWIIMQTDARFAVNIAYEKAHAENHGDVGITGNRVNLDTYLGATVELMEYCRTNNYPTKVLFTTGPVDKYNGESGYQAWLKNENYQHQ